MRVKGKPIHQKYRERRAEYEDCTFFNFLTNYEHSARKVHKPRPRAKPRVIIYMPLYDTDPGERTYEQFCRMKIALHHPWRKYPTLPYEGACSWSAAYTACKALCDRHDSDYLDIRPPKLEEDEFEPQEIAFDVEIGPEQLAGETANRNPAATPEDPDNLGGRTEDWRYDWSFHVGCYADGGEVGSVQDGPDWWKRARELCPQRQQVRWQSQGVVDRLAPEQRLIYDQVIGHYRRVLNGEHPQPLLLNIDGRAGTGKSFVIQVLSAHLQDMAARREAIIRCAPTGAASFGISGSTIHKIFKLPVGTTRKFDALSNESLASSQAALANVQYIILDEKS